VNQQRGGGSLDQALELLSTLLEQGARFEDIDFGTILTSGNSEIEARLIETLLSVDDGKGSRQVLKAMDTWLQNNPDKSLSEPVTKFLDSLIQKEGAATS